RALEAGMTLDKTLQMVRDFRETDDFAALGGEAAAKEAGKMRAEGKSYVVQDGDVLHFLFNT
ncbi:DUF933 domain-containing protein, partial [bacterium]|nr:DUF933 domain-containing protein [bacterium]